MPATNEAKLRVAWIALMRIRNRAFQDVFNKASLNYHDADDALKAIAAPGTIDTYDAMRKHQDVGRDVTGAKLAKSFAKP